MFHIKFQLKFLSPREPFYVKHSKYSLRWVYHKVSSSWCSSLCSGPWDCSWGLGLWGLPQLQPLIFITNTQSTKHMVKGMRSLQGKQSDCGCMWQVTAQIFAVFGLRVWLLLPSILTAIYLNRTFVVLWLTL